MRQITALLLSLFLIILSSCENEKSFSLNESLDLNELYSKDYINISEEEALELAINSYNHLIGLSPINSRSEDICIKVLNSPNSRAENKDTIAYIVNFPNNGGYAIVASNKKAVNPVLAVIPNGKLESIEDIDIPAQKAYINTLLNNIEISEDTPQSRAIIEPMPEYKVEIDTLSHSNGIISGLSWGQSNPYNEYFDNNIVGCYPLAISIILAKFEEPKNMTINFNNSVKESVNNTNISLDWKDIKKLKNKTQLDRIFGVDNPSKESLKNLEFLIRQIAEDGNAIYTSYGTTFSLKDGINVLKKYLKNKSVSNFKPYDRDEISKSLETGNIILYGELTTNPDESHTWVVEQFVYSDIIKRTYKREYMSIYWVLESTEYLSEHKMYFNWGWDGRGNGYYNCFYPTEFKNTSTNLTYGNLYYLVVK